jgi:CBS domain-containing protein
MGLLRIAQTPLVTVRPEATVLQAVQIMDRENIGAVAVVESGVLCGIFSERDVMLRVLLGNRVPEKTCIREVMTFPVETIARTSSPDDALKMMFEKHIRHLPVINNDGSLAGMLSIRNLLHQKVEDLTDQLDSLEAYFTADGAGG